MNDFFSSLLIAFIGFLGAIIGGKYSTKITKLETSRLVFDKSYSKIFSLIEDKFYNKNLSNNEIQKLGQEIYHILDSADGYYYPSLKQYASWMFSDTYSGNLQELWHSFCWTFDKEYERVSKQIGLPTRSRYYRMNKRQYSSKLDLFKIYFFSSYIIYDICILLMFVISFLLLKIIS